MRRSSILYTILAILLLWLAFRQVSPAAIVPLFQQIRGDQLSILLLLNGLVLGTLVLRWHLLLRAEGYRVPLLALLRYRLAAFGVTYFTPGPQFGGEPLQVLFLKQQHAIPLQSAIATVTMDKVLEMVANFGFLVGGALLLLRQGMIPQRIGMQGLSVGLLLFALPLTLLIAYLQGRQPLSALVRGTERMMPKPWRRGDQAWVRRAAAALYESEQQIAALCRHQPRHLVWSAFVTVVGWGLMIGEFAYAARIFGTSLTATEVTMVLVAARIAFLLPMPAGIGTLETSLTLAFQLLGLPPATGLALSLLIRARDVSLGLLGLSLGGITFLTQQDLRGLQ
ncbi:MAG: flippase-like domain-containing protein [Caldilineaceae bacterium]|nr:flippase-like domain-containing protein [Caldilineaceae bacterium]